MSTAKEIVAAAVALSLAGPDERVLPNGVHMAPFYRSLSRAAAIALLKAASEPTEGMVKAAIAERGKPLWPVMIRALVRELEEMTP